jgi:hypothetical protein
MKIAMLLVLALGVLAGCGGVPYSNPYASPDTSQQADCERRAGYWNPNAAVCESPLYRW